MDFKKESKKPHIIHIIDKKKKERRHKLAISGKHLDPHTVSYTNTNPECAQNLNIRSKTIK